MPPCKKLLSHPSLRALLLMLGMLMSTVCKPAALGDELILSQLGDPVEVEITVLQWEDIDLDQVQITAGTPEVYESFGLDYLPVLESLNFNVIGPTLAGEVKVLVSSREPMSEPYMQLLLVMRWPGGSLLREYVLIFDPPRPAAPAPVPVSSNVTAPPTPLPPEPAATIPPQVAAEPEDVSTTLNQNQPTTSAEEATAVANDELLATQKTEPGQEVTVQPAREIEVAVVETVVETAVETAVETEAETEVQVSDTSTRSTTTVAIRQASSYTVQSGDNLWDIATKHGPVGANANLYQILLSLYELNRDSFINGNISLLKYGAILQLPTVADVAAINPATAQNLFDQRWNEGSERIDIAARGEPLPPFSSIFEPVVARPEINPTADIQNGTGAQTAAQNNGGLALASGNALLPASQGAAAQSTVAVPGAPVSAGQAGIPTLALAPAANPGGVAGPANAAGTTAIALASTNPYLDGVNTSAQFMREMLDAKQQQIELIETQMEQMSIRMLEITRVTERLNTSLEEALAERAREQDSYQRDTLLLGGLILVLSIALIAIVAMVFKLAAQIRVQHEFLQGSIKTQQAVAFTAKHVAEQTVQQRTSPSDKPTTEKLQKAWSSEQALAVSIIEEDDDDIAPDSALRDERKLADLNVQREEVNVPIGDMDIEYPKAGDLPESSR